jgi:hypothetical protein
MRRNSKKWHKTQPMAVRSKRATFRPAALFFRPKVGLAPEKQAGTTTNANATDTKPTQEK